MAEPPRESLLKRGLEQVTPIGALEALNGGKLTEKINELVTPGDSVTFDLNGRIGAGSGAVAGLGFTVELEKPGVYVLRFHGAAGPAMWSQLQNVPHVAEALTALSKHLNMNVSEHLQNAATGSADAKLGAGFGLRFDGSSSTVRNQPDPQAAREQVEAAAQAFLHPGRWADGSLNQLVRDRLYRIDLYTNAHEDAGVQKSFTEALARVGAFANAEVKEHGIVTVFFEPGGLASALGIEAGLQGSADAGAGLALVNVLKTLPMLPKDFAPFLDRAGSVEAYVRSTMERQAGAPTAGPGVGGLLRNLGSPANELVLVFQAKGDKGQRELWTFTIRGKDGNPGEPGAPEEVTSIWNAIRQAKHPEESVRTMLGNKQVTWDHRTEQVTSHQSTIGIPLLSLPVSLQAGSTQVKVLMDEANGIRTFHSSYHPNGDSYQFPCEIWFDPSQPERILVRVAPSHQLQPDEYWHFDRAALEPLLAPGSPNEVPLSVVDEAAKDPSELDKGRTIIVPADALKKALAWADQVSPL